jgi:hypothetical protein
MPAAQWDKAHFDNLQVGRSLAAGREIAGMEHHMVAGEAGHLGKSPVEDWGSDDHLASEAARNLHFLGAGRSGIRTEVSEEGDLASQVAA